MADEMRVEFLGLQELRAGFFNAPAALNEADAEAITKSAFLVEAGAKSLVPRVTGRLGSSITSRVVGSGQSIRGLVGTTVVYGRMVEFGAPSGFPLNYSKGRRTKYGRTRAYIAHLQKARVGRLYMTRGLRENVKNIEATFRTTYIKFLGTLSRPR